MSGVGVEASKMDKQRWENFLSYLERPQRGQLGATSNANSTTAIDLVNDSHDGSSTAIENDLTAETEADLLKRRRLGETENVVVLSSDSENDDETIWSSYAKCKDYKRLWDKARCLVFYRLIPKYYHGTSVSTESYLMKTTDEQIFPYNKLKNLAEDLRKFQQDFTHNEEELNFLWNNVLQWLLAINQSLYPVDAKYDEKFNLILIEFMVQYVNYITNTFSSYPNEETIRENIQKVVQTLTVILSENTFYALMVLLRIELKLEYRGILDPIFRKYLTDPSLCHASSDLVVYLQLIFCFKRWKTITPLKTDRESINDLAVGKSSRKQNGKAGSEATDFTTESILPKCVPRVNENNKFFVSISDLIGFAIERKAFGTRILLVYTSLDLEDAIAKFLQMYVRYVSCNPGLGIPDAPTPPTRDSTDILKRPFKEIDRMTYSKKMDAPLRQQKQERKEQHSTNQPNQKATKLERNTKSSSKTSHITHFEKICDKNKFRPSNPSSCNISNISHSHNTNTQSDISLSSSMMMSGSVRKNTEFMQINLIDSDDEGRVETNKLKQSPKITKVSDLNKIDANGSNTSNSQQQETQKVKTHKRFVRRQRDKKQKESQLQGTDSKTNTKHSEETIVLTSTSSSSSSSDDENCLVKHPRNSDSDTVGRQTNSSSSIANETNTLALAEQSLPRIAAIPPRCRPLVESVATKPTRKEKHCIPGEVSSTTSPDCAPQTNRTQSVQEAQEKETSLSSFQYNVSNLEVHSAGTLQNAREVGIVKAVQQRISPCPPVVVSGTCKPGSLLLGIDYSDFSSDNEDLESEFGAHLLSQGSWKIVEEATSSTAEIPKTMTENIASSTRSERSRVKSRGNSLEKMCLLRNASKEKFDSEHSQSLEGTGNSKELVDRPTCSKYVETSSTLSTISQKGSKNRIKKGEIANENETHGSETMLVSFKQTQLLEPNCIKNSIEEANIESRGESRKTYLEKIDLLKEGDQTAYSTNSGGNKSYNTTEDIEKSLEKIDNVEAELIKTKETQAKYRTTDSSAALEKNLENSDILKKTEATEKPNMQMIVQETSHLNRPNENKCNTGASNVTTENIVAVETVVFAKLAEADKSFRASESIEAADIESLLKEIDENLNENNVFQNTKNKLNDDKGLEVATFDSKECDVEITHSSISDAKEPESCLSANINRKEIEDSLNKVHCNADIISKDEKKSEIQFKTKHSETKGEIKKQQKEPERISNDNTNRSDTNRSPDEKFKGNVLSEKVDLEIDDRETKSELTIIDFVISTKNSTESVDHGEHNEPKPIEYNSSLDVEDNVDYSKPDIVSDISTKLDYNEKSKKEKTILEKKTEEAIKKLAEEIEEEIEEKIKNQPIHSKLNVKCPKAIEDQDLICGDKSASEHLKPRIHERKALDSNVKNSTTDIEAINESECKQDEIVNEPSKDCLSEVPENTGFSCANSVHETISKAEKSQSESRAKNAAQICLKDNEKIILPQSDFVDLNISENKLTNDDMGSEDNAAENSTETMTKLVKPLELISNTNTYEQEERSSQDCAIDEVSQIGQNEVIGVTSEDKNIVELVGNETEKVKTSELSKSCIDLVLEKKEELIVTDKKTVEFETETQVTSPNSQLDLVKKASASNKTVPKIIDERLGETQSETLDKDNSNSTQDNKIKPAMSSVNREKEEHLEAENSAKKSAETSSLHYDQKYQEKTQTEEETLLERSKQIKEDNKKQSEEISTENNKTAIEHTFSQEIKNHEDLEGMNKISEKTFSQHACLEIHKETPTNFVEIELKDDVNTHQKVKAVISDNKKEESCEAKKSEIISADTSKELPNLINHKVLLSNVVDKVKIIDDTKNDHIEQLVDKSNDNNSLSNLISGENKEEEENQEATSLTMVEIVKLKNATKKDIIKQPVQKSKNDGLIAISAVKKRKLHSEIKNAVTMPDETSCFTVENREVIQPCFAEEVKRKDIKQGKTKPTVEESNDNSTKVISGENQEKEEESAQLSISEENQQKEGHNETENITTNNEKITPSTLAEKVKLKDVVKEKDQIDKPVQNSNYKLSAISDGNLEKAEYLEVEISSKISDKISSGHSSIDKDQLTSLPSLEKQKFTDETPIEHQNPEKQLLITPSVLVEYPKLSNGSRSDKPRKEKYGKVPKRSQAIKKENGQETSKRPKSSSEVPSIETSKESFDRDDSHTSKKTFETGEKICDDTSKLAYDDVDSISSPTKQRSVKENVDKRTSGKVRIKRRIGLCSDINKEFNSESKDAQMGLLDSISQKTRKNIDIAKETDELVLNISRLKIANYKTDSESDDSQEESDVGDLKKVLLGNLGLKRTRSNLESEIELKNSENNKDIADIMQGRRKKQKIVKHTLKKSSLLPEPLELMPSNYNNEELAAVTALINMQKQCALTTGEKSNDLSANVKDDNLEETTDTSRLSGTGKVKVQLKKYSPQEDHTSGSTVAVTSIKPILKSALKSCDGSIKEKVMKKVQYDEASLLLLKKHSEIRQGKKAFQNLKKTRSEEGALLKGGNKLLKKRLAEINARFDREYMTDVKDVQEVSPSFETESIIKTTKGQRKKIKISDPLTVSSRKELENTVSKLAERIKHLHTNDELSNRSTFERCTPILQHTVEIPKPRRGRKKRAPQESEIEEDEPASLVETSTNKISEINSEKIGVNPVCPISKECTEIQNESTNSESSISILPASIEVPKQILSKDKITGAEDNSVLPNVGDEPKLVEKLLVERNVTPCDSDLKQKEKDQNEKNDVNSMQEIETESSIDANSTVKSRNELSLIKENDKQQGIEKCNKMKKAFVKIKRVSIPMQTAIVSEIVSNKAVLLNSILEDCPIKKEPIDDTQSTSPSPNAIDIEIKEEEEEEESLDTDKFTQMQNDFSFPEDPAGATKAHTFKEIIVRPCDVILTADIINAQAVRIKEIAREKRKIKRILRTRSLLRKVVAKNVNVESGLKSLPKRLKKSVVFSKPMEVRKEPAIASENRQIKNDTISINNANNILSSNMLKLTDAARTEVTIATKTNDNDVNANKKKGEETLLEKKTSLVRKESNKLDEMILTKDSKVNLTPDEKDRPSQNFCKNKEKEMSDSLSTPENEVNDLNQKKEQNYSKPKKCASKQELITMGDGIVPGKLIKTKTKEEVHDKDTSVVKEKITDLPVNVNEVINCESMNASNKDSRIIEPCESKKTIISAKDSEVKLISEEENEPSDTCTKQEKESTESRSPPTNEIKDLNQNKKQKSAKIKKTESSETIISDHDNILAPKTKTNKELIEENTLVENKKAKDQTVNVIEAESREHINISLEDFLAEERSDTTNTIISTKDSKTLLPLEDKNVLSEVKIKVNDEKNEDKKSLPKKDYCQEDVLSHIQKQKSSKRKKISTSQGMISDGEDVLASKTKTPNDDDKKELAEKKKAIDHTVNINKTKSLQPENASKEDFTAEESYEYTNAIISTKEIEIRHAPEDKDKDKDYVSKSFPTKNCRVLNQTKKQKFAKTKKSADSEIAISNGEDTRTSKDKTHKDVDEKETLVEKDKATDQTVNVNASEKDSTTEKSCDSMNPITSTKDSKTRLENKNVVPEVENKNKDKDIVDNQSVVATDMEKQKFANTKKSFASPLTISDGEDIVVWKDKTHKDVNEKETLEEKDKGTDQTVNVIEAESLEPVNVSEKDSTDEKLCDYTNPIASTEDSKTRLGSKNVAPEIEDKNKDNGTVENKSVVATELKKQKLAKTKKSSTSQVTISVSEAILASKNKTDKGVNEKETLVENDKATDQIANVIEAESREPVEASEKDSTTEKSFESMNPITSTKNSKIRVDNKNVAPEIEDKNKDKGTVENKSVVATELKKQKFAKTKKSSTSQVTISDSKAILASKNKTDKGVNEKETLAENYKATDQIANVIEAESREPVEASEKDSTTEKSFESMNPITSTKNSKFRVDNKNVAPKIEDKNKDKGTVENKSVVATELKKQKFAKTKKSSTSQITISDSKAILASKNKTDKGVNEKETLVENDKATDQIANVIEAESREPVEASEKDSTTEKSCNSLNPIKSTKNSKIRVDNKNVAPEIEDKNKDKGTVENKSVVATELKKQKLAKTKKSSTSQVTISDGEDGQNNVIEAESLEPVNVSEKDSIDEKLCDSTYHMTSTKDSKTRLENKSVTREIKDKNKDKDTVENKSVVTTELKKTKSGKTNKSSTSPVMITDGEDILTSKLKTNEKAEDSQLTKEKAKHQTVLIKENKPCQSVNEIISTKDSKAKFATVENDILCEKLSKQVEKENSDFITDTTIEEKDLSRIKKEESAKTNKSDSSQAIIADSDGNLSTKSIKKNKEIVEEETPIEKNETKDKKVKINIGKSCKSMNEPKEDAIAPEKAAEKIEEKTNMKKESQKTIEESGFEAASVIPSTVLCSTVTKNTNLNKRKRISKEQKNSKLKLSHENIKNKDIVETSDSKTVASENRKECSFQKLEKSVEAQKGNTTKKLTNIESDGVSNPSATISSTVGQKETLVIKETSDTADDTKQPNEVSNKNEALSNKGNQDMKSKSTVTASSNEKNREPCVVSTRKIEKVDCNHKINDYKMISSNNGEVGPIKSSRPTSLNIPQTVTNQGTKEKSSEQISNEIIEESADKITKCVMAELKLLSPQRIQTQSSLHMDSDVEIAKKLDQGIELVLGNKIENISQSPSTSIDKGKSIDDKEEKTAALLDSAIEKVLGNSASTVESITNNQPKTTTEQLDFAIDTILGTQNKCNEEKTSQVVAPTKLKLGILTAEKINSSIEKLLERDRKNDLDHKTAETLNQSIEKILGKSIDPIEEVCENQATEGNSIDAVKKNSPRPDDVSTKKPINKKYFSDMKIISANVPEALFADDDSDNSNSGENSSSENLKFFPPILSLDDLLHKKTEHILKLSCCENSDSCSCNSELPDAAEESPVGGSRPCLGTPNFSAELEVQTSKQSNAEVKEMEKEATVEKNTESVPDIAVADAVELPSNLVEVNATNMENFVLSDISAIGIPIDFNMANESFPDVMDIMLLDQVQQSIDCVMSGNNYVQKWTNEGFTAQSGAKKNCDEKMKDQDIVPIPPPSEQNNICISEILETNPSAEHSPRTSSLSIGPEMNYSSLSPLDEVEVSTTIGFDLVANVTVEDLLANDSDDLFAFPELDKTRSRTNSYSNDSEELSDSVNKPDENIALTTKIIACDHSYNKDIEEKDAIKSPTTRSPNKIASPKPTSNSFTIGKTMSSELKKSPPHSFTKLKSHPTPFWIKKADLKTSTPKRSASSDEPIEEKDSASKILVISPTNPDIGNVQKQLFYNMPELDLAPCAPTNVDEPTKSESDPNKPIASAETIPETTNVETLPKTTNFETLTKTTKDETLPKTNDKMLLNTLNVETLTKKTNAETPTETTNVETLTNTTQVDTRTKKTKIETTTKTTNIEPLTKIYVESTTNTTNIETSADNQNDCQKNVECVKNSSKKDSVTNSQESRPLPNRVIIEITEIVTIPAPSPIAQETVITTVDEDQVNEADPEKSSSRSSTPSEIIESITPTPMIITQPIFTIQSQTNRLQRLNSISCYNDFSSFPSSTIISSRSVNCSPSREPTPTLDEPNKEEMSVDDSDALFNAIIEDTRESNLKRGSPPTYDEPPEKKICLDTAPIQFPIKDDCFDDHKEESLEDVIACEQIVENNKVISEVSSGEISKEEFSAEKPEEGVKVEKKKENDVQLEDSAKLKKSSNDVKQMCEVQSVENEKVKTVDNKSQKKEMNTETQITESPVLTKESKIECKPILKKNDTEAGLESTTPSSHELNSSLVQEKENVQSPSKVKKKTIPAVTVVGLPKITKQKDNPVDTSSASKQQKKDNQVDSSSASQQQQKDKLLDSSSASQQQQKDSPGESSSASKEPQKDNAVEATSASQQQQKDNSVESSSTSKQQQKDNPMDSSSTSKQIQKDNPVESLSVSMQDINENNSKVPTKKTELEVLPTRRLSTNTNTLRNSPYTTSHSLRKSPQKSSPSSSTPTTPNSRPHPYHNTSNNGRDNRHKYNYQRGPMPNEVKNPNKSNNASQQRDKKSQQFMPSSSYKPTPYAYSQFNYSKSSNYYSPNFRLSAADEAELRAKLDAFQKTLPQTKIYKEHKEQQQLLKLQEEKLRLEYMEKDKRRQAHKIMMDSRQKRKTNSESYESHIKKFAFSSGPNNARISSSSSSSSSGSGGGGTNVSGSAISSGRSNSIPSHHRQVHQHQHPQKQQHNRQKYVNKFGEIEKKAAISKHSKANAHSKTPLTITTAWEHKSASVDEIIEHFSKMKKA